MTTTGEQDKAFLLSREDFITFWGPRLGTDAAVLRWKAARDNVVGGWVSVAGIFVASLGGRWHSLAFILFGIVLAMAGVWVWASGMRALKASYRATSRALGFPVGIRKSAPPPPRERSRYEAWCNEYSVVPYSLK